MTTEYLNNIFKSIGLKSKHSFNGPPIFFGMNQSYKFELKWVTHKPRRLILALGYFKSILRSFHYAKLPIHDFVDESPQTVNLGPFNKKNWICFICDCLLLHVKLFFMVISTLFPYTHYCQNVFKRKANCILCLLYTLLHDATILLYASEQLVSKFDSYWCWLSCLLCDKGWISKSDSKFWDERKWQQLWISLSRNIFLHKERRLNILKTKLFLCQIAKTILEIFKDYISRVCVTKNRPAIVTGFWCSR